MLIEAFVLFFNSFEEEIRNTFCTLLGNASTTGGYLHDLHREQFSSS